MVPAAKASACALGAHSGIGGVAIKQRTLRRARTLTGAGDERLSLDRRARRLGGRRGSSRTPWHRRPVVAVVADVTVATYIGAA